MLHQHSQIDHMAIQGDLIGTSIIHRCDVVWFRTFTVRGTPRECEIASPIVARRERGHKLRNVMIQIYNANKHPNVYRTNTASFPLDTITNPFSRAQCEPPLVPYPRV